MPLSFTKNSILVFSVIAIISILFGILLDQKIIIALPFILLSCFFLILDYRIFYWIIIASIPFSVQHDFSSSLSTDFPIEFISIALMGAFWAEYFATKRKDLKELWESPIVLLLIFLFLWSAITSLTAVNKLIAFKYTLAKTWFISTYLILTFSIIKTQHEIKRLFWVFFVSLFITTLYSFGRTAIGNFDFERTNEFSLPFYINHVIYATMITLFIPFVWWASSWYQKGTIVRTFLKCSTLFFIIAVYFSYTRACMLALVAAIIYYFLVRWKKSITFFLLAITIVLAGLLLISKDYNYLRLAPDYTTTVMHGNFQDHVTATFQGKDASSMERINMWVSVFRMSSDYFWMGVGPNNFPFNYKPYSVLYFKTWVSDNPLNLSCHNYFLLMLAEQGIIGVALFVLFVIVFLSQVEKTYHLAIVPFHRQLVLVIGSSFVILLVNLIFSDLIESGKSGAFFFILCALVVKVKIWVNESRANS